MTKDKEKLRAKRRRWLNRTKNNPLRYRKLLYGKMAYAANNRCHEGKVTTSQVSYLAEKQKFICPFTGEKLTNENILLDHIIPISKGGTNDLSNLQLTTVQCNVAKGSMTCEEFCLFCQKVATHSRVVPPH